MCGRGWFSWALCLTSTTSLVRTQQPSPPPPRTRWAWAPSGGLHPLLRLRPPLLPSPSLTLPHRPPCRPTRLPRRPRPRALPAAPASVPPSTAPRGASPACPVECPRTPKDCKLSRQAIPTSLVYQAIYVTFSLVTFNLLIRFHVVSHPHLISLATKMHLISW